ncbi:DUF4431 domain-containing protein [Pseudomonas abietaniphila]|uniref:DUF4431 domain-containing protein n=1 Tax=Pseudomonas abietaniphila TaxID=89065 RepID=A0A1G7ZN64_9PSED|nr:DUF4431 domain-containing protein [Pseudomonas abietaniphila]SDH10202.1 protein of unknown function [Pseudomonas abietaniphila]
MTVTPCLRALPFLVVCLSPFSVAQAATCNQYEPADATLSGTLTRQVFPGPPGFEDVVTGDEPQVGFYLSLAEPLCMKGNENEADIDVEDNETLVQLVLQPTDYDNLRPYLDQPVVLKGTLFGAVTGFHHTQVLMQQVQLMSGMAGAPVDCELLNQKVGMHEETYSPSLQGKIIGGKAWVYQAPNPTCTSKREFLAQGTPVSVTVIANGGWVLAQYTAEGGKPQSVWLDQAQVVLGLGDAEE